MAAALSRTPKRLPFSSKFLSSSTFSTTPTPPNPDSLCSAFLAAKSAILYESDPQKLAQIFIQSSHLHEFRRYRPIYVHSIHKLARAKRFDVIDDIIQSQHSSSSAGSEGFWIRLIMLYSNAGMIDQALRTLDRVILNKPCDLSEKSLSAVLSACLDNSLPDMVIEMFGSIPEKIGVVPSVVSYNMVLKAFVQQNDMKSARDWVDEMCKDDSKVVPNIESYNILLGGYWNNRDLVGFDGILKEIQKRGLEFNLVTYNYRISSLCKNKECARAKKLLEEMISKGVKPNSGSYDAIIHGFCKVGDIESAMKLLKGMLEDGHVSPTSRIYYTLIRSMVKEGEFDMALETFREIMNRRWVPPFEAVEGLVCGLVGMSKVEEAKEVVEKMKKMLKGSAVDSWVKIEETGDSVLLLKGPQGRINRAVGGPLNKTIISAGEDAIIRIWDSETGKLLKESDKETGHKKTIISLVKSSDGSHFISGSLDKSARLWDIRTLTRIKTYLTERPVNAVTMSPLLDHVVLGGGQDASSVTTTDIVPGSSKLNFMIRSFKKRLEA